MILNEKNIVRVISVGPLIFIPLIVIIIVLYGIKVHNDNFDRIISNIEIDLKIKEQASIESKVNSMVDLASYRKSLVKSELKARVKERVENALLIADKIYDKYKDTKSKEEILDIIKLTIRPLLWNNGESFIWILDYNGVFNLAPEYLKHLEGTSIMNFQDAKGRYVIQEEIALCKAKGEGFLWDTFTKPNDTSKKQYKQVAFVKSFGKYNLYFGSGEYLDTASKKTDFELLNSIKKIDRESGAYIFVLNTQRDMLLNPSIEKYSGNEIDDIQIYNVSTKIIEQVSKKNNSFLSYKWINPISGKLDIKHTYVKKVLGSDWIIGSGFYDSKIKDMAKQQTFDLYKSYRLEFYNLALLSLVLIISSLIISHLLSRYLKKIFNEYEITIDKEKMALKSLNETLEDKVAQRTEKLQKVTKSLEILATTDSLTKINNRYSIMKIIEMETSRAKRNKSKLSIAMYDLDFFKKVNDNYGHDIGDEVLCETTNLIKENLRGIDFIGRYGGEEFLIVMPDTDLIISEEILLRIHNLIQNTKYTSKELDDVTISIGLVEYIDGENTNDLLKRLDNLLYDSKNQGRNRLSK